MTLAVRPGTVRAICFDLDNTLWEIEPVLARAERILADWLAARYPKIPERFSPADMFAVREALLRERPDQAHDLTFLRRETLARLAEAVGYERSVAHAAFATWHAARNQCVPFSEVPPALEKLKTRYRLATLSNGNADLGTIGIAHHFEVTLHAAALGCAKPDARVLPRARRRADAETRGNTVCRRRSPGRRCRSAQRWHANCMDESRRKRMAGGSASGRPCRR